MQETHAISLFIPARIRHLGIMLTAVLLLAGPYADAAQAVIWKVAATDPSAVFQGNMTSSTTYTGGKDADSQRDALSPRLVYANSTSNSMWGGSSDLVTYTVSIPTTGYWYLWGRLYVPTAPLNVNGDSFFVRVDNGLRMTLGNNKDYHQKFAWVGNGSIMSGTPRPLRIGYLKAGTHKITIEKREVLPTPPRLDVLALSIDPAFVPTDAAATEGLQLGGGSQTGQLTMLPTAVSFGKVTVGTASNPSNVVVTNTGQSTLNITGLAITGTNKSSFSTTAKTSFSLAPKQAATVAVTFKPVAVGAATAALEITSGSGKGTAALQGEGATASTTPGKLQVSPTSLSFGSVTSGTQSQASTVTISNTGGSELSVSAISISGANAAEFKMQAPTVPLRIAAQAKATVQVTYAPSHTGASTANLLISSSVSLSPVTVALSGTGTAPDTGGGTGGTGENDNSPLGTNLTGLNDWSPEWSFIDAFKMSREWCSSTDTSWDDGRTLSLDADGWVKSLASGQYARTLLFWDLTSLYPSGDYIVLYDGQGVLDYQFAASKDAGLSKPGRDVVHVDASQGGFSIVIKQTNSADYIRNIRVIMPGGMSPQNQFAWYPSASGAPSDYKPFEQIYQTQVFHPAFLNSVKKYRVLRFMDWMRTNESTQRNWTDRAKPTNARYNTVKGAPLEVMISLANKLHAGPWFCLPHMATDDYVRQFCTLVKSQLASDLQAYYEYSNEVWNWMFPQAQYASDQGLALGLHDDKYQALFYYHSLRTVQMFKVLEQVYGSELSRAVRCLGAQADGWWWSEEMLKYQNAYQHCDAMAIAPYFGGGMGSSESISSVQNMSLDQAFARLNSVDIPDAINSMKMQSDVCSRYNVAMVAYEGGQHLVISTGDDNSRVNSLFDAMNRDPRMGAAYTTYLNGWKQYGGDVFVHYVNCCNYSNWGRWGAMENLFQSRSQAPKYDALQRFIESNS
jgi:hypothetical protein